MILAKRMQMQRVNHQELTLNSILNNATTPIIFISHPSKILIPNKLRDNSWSPQIQIVINKYMLIYSKSICKKHKLNKWKTYKIDINIIKIQNKNKITVQINIITILKCCSHQK